MAKKVKKEPEGVVIAADKTGPLHVQLRAHAGMPQAFEVRFDGKVQKMKGIKVLTLVDPRPYGTLVLDFLTVKPKAIPEGDKNWTGASSAQK